MTTVRVMDVGLSRGAFTLGPVTTTFDVGVTALLGANGAGKTTLMQIVVGILVPRRGSVHVVDGGSAGVGYLPQDFEGPARVRVGDYLRFVGWCRSRRGRRIGADDVGRVLGRVGLGGHEATPFGELSGGMVRRVGIAQALLGGAEVVVLDEPTVGLDPIQRREIRDLLTELGADTVVLVSTHLSEDVAAVADRVLVLDMGRVTYADDVAGLVRLGGGGTVDGRSVELGFLSCIGGAAGRTA